MRFLDNEALWVLYERRPEQTEDGSWLLVAISPLPVRHSKRQLTGAPWLRWQLPPTQFLFSNPEIQPRRCRHQGTLSLSCSLILLCILGWPRPCLLHCSWARMCVGVPSMAIVLSILIRSQDAQSIQQLSSFSSCFLYRLFSPQPRRTLIYPYLSYRALHLHSIRSA